MIKTLCCTFKYESEQSSYYMQKTKIQDFLNTYHNNKMHAVVHYSKLIKKNFIDTNIHYNTVVNFYM